MSNRSVATAKYLHSNMDRFESFYSLEDMKRVLIDLHSNMDRFESCPALTVGGVALHLHSNMDRFESSEITAEIADFVDLHSNMDRFESQHIYLNVFKIFYIYIPIWIDLKVLFRFGGDNLSNIYIPIWIDLKGNVWFRLSHL